MLTRLVPVSMASTDGLKDRLSDCPHQTIHSRAGTTMPVCPYSVLDCVSVSVMHNTKVSFQHDFACNCKCALRSCNLVVLVSFMHSRQK